MERGDWKRSWSDIDSEGKMKGSGWFEGKVDKNFFKDFMIKVHEN